MTSRKFRKRKSNKFMLLALLLVISVGFALLSTTLKIDGLFGVKGNTWDIHWENVQPNQSSTGTAETPTIDESKTIVNYEVALELPGDFYEFDVDAKNDGTVAGSISEIKHNIKKVVEEGQDSTPPDYIIYSVVYKGTNIAPRKGDVLGPGEKQTYTVRIEFDKNATEVPGEDTTVRIEDEFDYDQEDIRGKNKITFNPNGGTVQPTYKYVEEGQKIGTMPVAFKENYEPIGWYDEDSQSGEEITSTFEPEQDMELTVQWTDSFATFLPGPEVNAKFKSLAGDNVSVEVPYTVSNTNITSVVKSNTAPPSGTTTEIVSVEGEIPIYAWFENGTIKLYSEADYLFLNEDASYMFYKLTNLTNVYTDYRTSKTTNMTAMFGTTSLESIDVTKFDTSNVTYLTGMFSSTGLSSIDVSNFDTSNTTDMGGMFQGSSQLTSIDVSNFNTQNLRNMASMFNGCSSLTELDLSNFDVSKVVSVDSSSGFGGIIANSGVQNLNISGWNFASATTISGMFAGVTSLKTINLNKVNTSTITDMGGMFSGCSGLTSLDVSSFDTSNVTNMGGMFNGCSSLTSLDLSKFSTQSVTNMGGMLGGMTSLKTLNLSNFDLTNYNSSSLMMNMTNGGFSSLEKLIMDKVKFSGNVTYALGGLSTVQEISLKNVDTTGVTDMTAMFNSDYNLTELDLTSFNTSNVTNMSSMFASDNKLETIIVSDDFVVTQVTSSGSMFSGCTSLVGGAGTIYDSNHTDKAYAHYDGGEDDPGYFNEDPSLARKTITFNPNGGTVDPTTKEVVVGRKAGNLPVPTKGNTGFKGWYTLPDSGVKITKDTLINDDITIYAHWYDNVEITYNGNSGSFDNNPTNVINYSYGSVPVTKYSHTSNIDDAGVANGEYSDNLAVNDIIKIEGAEQLTIELWYSTESTSYDWVAIYGAGITPDQNNYSQSITGKLGNGRNSTKEGATHTTITVPGDTAQFFFRSDSSGTYYGYYAIVTGTGKGYAGDTEYKEPTRNNYHFTGWNTESDGSGRSYKTEKEVVNDIEGELLKTGDTLYAQWIEKYTITFNANGGETDESTREIIKGNKIGSLPYPTWEGHAFRGWYTVDEIKITENYEPNSNITLYAHWNEIKTMFDVGPTVNSKIKHLVGTGTEGNDESTTKDTTVTTIVRNTTAPAEGTTTIDVSVPGSVYPIYAWYVGSGTVLYYSEAETIYANPNSSYMFSYFDSLSHVDTSFDTTLVQTAYYMFGDDTHLSHIDVSSWNTENMTDMSYMFYNMKALTSIDLSSFNTKKTTNMNSMIGNIPALVSINLSNFDFTAAASNNFSSGYLISRLTSGTYSNIISLTLDNAILPPNMYQGFSYMSSLQQISLDDVDTSNVTSMYELFYNCTSITSLDLSSFDTSKVTNMEYMFYYCSNLRNVNLSSFNTSKVTTFKYMFYNCSKLMSLDISNFDIRAAGSNLGSMFSSCNELTTLNMSNLDFSNYSNQSLMTNLGNPSSLRYLIMNNATLAPNMNYALAGLSNLEEIYLDNVNTSNVIDMGAMFYNDSKITELDLGSFDTRKVVNMSSMFYSMTSLKTIYVSDSFVVSQVTSSSSMFYNDTKLVGGNGTVYDSSHTDKEYAHYDGGEGNPGYFDKDTPIHIVTFNPNGGTVNPESTKARYGKPISQLPTPTREGYTFLGWWTDLETGIKVDESYIIRGSITLNAKWVKDISSATITPEYIEMDKGETDQIEVTDVEEEYTFTSNDPSIATVDSNGLVTGIEYGETTITVTGVISETTKTIPVDITTPKYRIYLHGNGVEVEPSMIRIEQGDPITDLPTPTREGHTFMGWYTLIDAGIKIENGYTPDGNMHLYAHWIKDVSSMIINNSNIVVKKLNTKAIDIRNANEIEETYQFISSDIQIGTVDSAGEVTGVNNGTHTVTIRGDISNKTKTINVNVVEELISKFNDIRDSVSTIACGYYSCSSSNITSFERTDTLSPTSDVVVASTNDSNVPIYMWSKNSKIYWFADIDEVYLNTDASWAFYGHKKITKIDLSGINTINTTTMEGMFYQCEKLKTLNLSGLDTRNVTNMNEMFNRCFEIETLDLSSFNTSNVTTMEGMFEYCRKLKTINLSSFNTTNVTSMKWMFKDCESIETLNLSNFNTSNVTNMYYLFGGCSSLTSLNISTWNTSNVTTMEYMFFNCSSMPEINLSNFNTSNVTNMSGMFSYCSSAENINVSSFDTRKVVNMGDHTAGGGAAGMFYECSSLRSINLSNFRTPSLRFMRGMFRGCTSLTTLDLSTFDTSNVTEMYNIFNGCTNLTSINLSGWNTSGVKDMESLFRNCPSLTTLDLSSFSSESLSRAPYMFQDDSALTTIYVTDFELVRKASTRVFANAFKGCTSLVGGQGTTYDYRYVDEEYGHIDGGSSNKGYFTLKTQ